MNLHRRSDTPENDSNVDISSDDLVIIGQSNRPHKVGHTETAIIRSTITILRQANANPEKLETKQVYLICYILIGLTYMTFTDMFKCLYMTFILFKC